MTMTASDVRACLSSRWPDSEYLVIPEAPQDAARARRKIDLLVVSLWQSRGYQLDAVEIKVSMSDWKRELDNPAKADWWWSHSHRFWLAVPAVMVPKVQPDLPVTWGLLACDGGACKAVVKAAKRDAEPFTWQSTIGLLRAAADAGFGALQRARDAGYQDGVKRGRMEVERETGDAYIRKQLDDLRQKVEAFQQASGVDIAQTWDAGELGRAFALATDWRLDPTRAADRLGKFGEQVAAEAKRINELAKELAAEITPPMLGEAS